METAVFGLAVLALIALGVALVLQARVISRLLDVIGTQAERHQDERHELVNRLQFPDRTPTKSKRPGSVQSSLTPEQRASLASVGTVAPQQVTDADN